MGMDGDLHLLARRPDRVVVAVRVIGIGARVVIGDGSQQNATAQSSLLGPLDLAYGGVDVMGGYDGHPRVPLRGLGAIVCQPTVIRSSPSELELCVGGAGAIQGVERRLIPVLCIREDQL